MDWKATRPAIEIAAESVAAASVASAAGFATWALAPVGPGIVAAVAAVAAGSLAGIAAWLVIGRVDRLRRPSGAGFAPVDFVGEPDVLLLDDPLPALATNSRVVQLFAGPPNAGDASPLPAPGEMVARIEDFLGGTRGGAAANEPAPIHYPAPDASAALHAALADIRRSLRQG